MRALDSVERTLGDNAERADLIRRRIAAMQDLRRSGVGYTQIANSHEGTLVVGLLTEMLNVLANAGHQLRRAEAEALRAEGLTMQQVATLFGVSRQRVSTLLSERS